MIRIIEVGDVAWQGKTEPVFCHGDDGFEYVVKGRGNAGCRALIAEWVANRLGRLIGLPIPEIAQMQIAPALFDYGADKEKLAKLGRGILFGSQKISHVDELRETDIKSIDIHLRAKVLLFDWWIANSDRIFVNGRGNPNLLWAEDAEALVVIDHNLAFLPDEMRDFWQNHAFRDARSIWTPAFRGVMEAQFSSALSELQVIWNEIPEEWTEFETELTLAYLESILWKFDTEATSFWNPS